MLSRISRSASWCDARGEAATVSALAEVLGRHITLIIDKGDDLYDSDDMAVGLNHALLVQAAPLLEDLLRLDSRGGIFSQTHLQTALSNAVAETDSQAKFMAKKPLAVNEQKDWEALCAYRIRVMLAHLRIAYDNNITSGEEHVLKTLLDHIGPAAASQTPGSAKRARRHERALNRPNPFVHWRDLAGDEEPEESEVPTIVSRAFNARTMKAEMILSDGSKLLADRYDKGSAGFVTAVWHSPPTTLLTEVPNAYCEGGAITATKPTSTTPTARTMKRPSSSRTIIKREMRVPRGGCKQEGAAHEEEEAAEEAAEEAVEHDATAVQGGPAGQVTGPTCKFSKPTCKFCTQRRASRWVVLVRGSSTKDQCMVLNITDNSCEGTGQTAKQVADGVCRMLEEYKAHLTKNGCPPIIKNDGVFCLKSGKPPACSATNLHRALRLTQRPLLCKHFLVEHSRISNAFNLNALVRGAPQLALRCLVLASF